MHCGAEVTESSTNKQQHLKKRMRERSKSMRRGKGGGLTVYGLTGCFGSLSGKGEPSGIGVFVCVCVCVCVPSPR
jgi:hypothetical protein